MGVTEAATLCTCKLWYLDWIPICMIHIHTAWAVSISFVYSIIMEVYFIQLATLAYTTRGAFVQEHRAELRNSYY